MSKPRKDIVMKTILAAAIASALLLPLTAASHAAYKTPGAYGGDGVATASVMERRKKRVPGGSGCDDPHDIREHPECRR
jgi:Spy/CpxP family protein refolding chaperone